MENLIAGATALLSVLVTQPAPWRDIQSNSDMRQPLYLGVPPREMAVYGRSSDRIELPRALKAVAERQATRIAAGLADRDGALQLEAWPVSDDDGKRTWAFARWRTGSGKAWRWIEASAFDDAGLSLMRPAPALPFSLDASLDSDRALIFDDFLKLEDLYDKPYFSYCVWTQPGSAEPFAAWLPVTKRETMKRRLSGSICHVLPQPARFDDSPLSIVLSVSGGRVAWPEGLGWREEDESLPKTGTKRVLGRFPDTFLRDYRDDVVTITGEQDAIFPRSGKIARFVKKNCAQPDHQLLELVSYLEERYAALGIRTWRQEFIWHGIPQSNLIAVIPGSLPGAENRPVLMADHIDTAFAEDTYVRNKQRVAVPGADDNVTAVAALLRAAEMLRGLKPLHDIWLVHLTGEEFPGDDLGARKLVNGLLNEGRDITGLVLLDMIGHNESGEALFQLNPGQSEESRRIAMIAVDASKDVSPSILPIVRTRYDNRSYLYNTDGLIFAEAGYPVVLFNEHINRLENFTRRHYHESSDVSKFVDWKYATSITKVAIETVARLATGAR